MLFLDTSALLERHQVEEEGTVRTLELMAADERWCASALCLAEAQVTLTFDDRQAGAGRALGLEVAGVTPRSR